MILNFLLLDKILHSFSFYFNGISKIWQIFPQKICLLQKDVYICNASEKKYNPQYPTDYPLIDIENPSKNLQASNSLLKDCIVNY
jgi:hypothetical protein